MTLFITFVLLALSYGQQLQSEHPMPSSTDRAIDAMKKRQYGEAAELWRQAATEGGDPELCLGRLAECQVYLGLIDAALATCNELEAQPLCNESPDAAYVRGLAYSKQKKTAEARYHWNVAAMRKHPLAVARLEAMNKK